MILLRQISHLARRSILRTLRQPEVIVSALLFPMIFFAISSSGLDAAVDIPGFPASSYLDFAFAFPLVQASLFGAVITGADLARDIEFGFLDRPSLTPIRPVPPPFFLCCVRRGLSRVGQVPGFDFSAGYTAFQFVWSLLQAVALGGAFTWFSIAGDFESGFARRFLLAASNRRGIILGYALASFIRMTVTGTLLILVALVGMQIYGGVDYFGLVGLAVLVNVAATLFGAGVAMLFRTPQAGPVIRTPIFLILFLAPVFVPQELLAGWISGIAVVNPMTFILETGRRFVLGEPTDATFAFGVAISVVLLLIPWALFGLHRAEKAG